MVSLHPPSTNTISSQDSSSSGPLPTPLLSSSAVSAAASTTSSSRTSSRTSSKNSSSTSTNSAAKKRMEALTTQMDHKLTMTLAVIILVLYTFITVTTWSKLPGLSISATDGNGSSSRQDNNNVPFFERMTTNHNTNGGSSSSRSNLPQVKQPESLQQQQEQELLPPQHPIYQLKDITTLQMLQHTFPIHANIGTINADVEEIDHPGALLANQDSFQSILQAHKSEGMTSKMIVPKFWNPQLNPGEFGPNGNENVRDYLGSYGQRLVTVDEATSIGNFDTELGKETIYVSVASYRDPECRPTIIDLYERAEYPNRIRVAILDQRTEDDPHCAPDPMESKELCTTNPNHVFCLYRYLIDVYEVPAILSVGPVFARHLANRLYRGEYFAMQVDSHVRFIEHWDEDLITQWRSAKNEMAVITTYLSDINGSIDPIHHTNQHPQRPIMCKTDYEAKGKLRHLRHGQQPEGIPFIKGTPTLEPFWAAGFSFARGHFVVQVPYDQYLPMVFQGEEISMGLRGFTYGYDYYTAETSVAFHMYAIKENKEKRKKVKLFWENTNLYPGSAVEGMKRLNGIIGMSDDPINDTYYTVEEKKYGLGQVRPKEWFYRLYGIHTDTKTVEDHLCTFVGRPMQNLLIPLLRPNGMGLDLSKTDYAFVDPQAKKPVDTPAAGVSPTAAELAAAHQRQRPEVPHHQ